MRRRLIGYASSALVLAIGAAAHASVTINQFDTTTNSGSNSGFTAWGVVPNSADSTSNPTAAMNATNLPSFSSPENNYGSVPSGGSLAQSMEALKAGTLTDLEIAVTGNPSGVTLNLALYDAGPESGAGGGLVDTGPNGYGNGTGVTSPSVSGSVVPVTNNLLAADSQGLTLSSYTLNGADAAELDFKLSGADAITINAGDEYVLEINDVVSESNLLWLRNSATATEYNLGQAFRGRASLNGNNNRDFAAAMVVSVPEPATLGLVAMAGLGLLARRRRA